MPKEETVIALTGADMDARLNDRYLPPYLACAVRPGDTLALAMAKYGCRGYLSVSGGFDVPYVLGSRSTDLKCGIGGLSGRALRKDDTLRIRLLRQGRTEKDTQSYRDDRQCR